MTTTTIQLNEKQLLGALSNYQPTEIKRLISRLVRMNLYTPPSLEAITRTASASVQRNKTPESTVMEAVEWARAQK
jgi:hypothetical protein